MTAPAPSTFAGTANINGSCYGAKDIDTVGKVVGDEFTIFASYGSGATALICFAIFLYFAIKTKGTFAIIIAGCCAISLITSIVQYFQAKNDIENLKTSGKLQKIPC
jgi:hypothetical protein